MKTALMQPYFFPYIGYYQLVNYVDEFIFFDDVNFSKKSYVSRNVILLDGRPVNFSVPVRKKSQNKKIMDHRYHDHFDKFLNQIHAGYKNTPYFSDVFKLIESVAVSGDSSVSIKNANSIRAVFDYLNIKKCFTFSSSLALGDELRGQQRVIRICKLKKATTYVNPIGGIDLYEDQMFSNAAITLEFFKPGSVRYRQEKVDTFIPALSMIDVLMWNDKSKIKELLGIYSIVQ